MSLSVVLQESCQLLPAPAPSRHIRSAALCPDWAKNSQIWNYLCIEKTKRGGSRKVQQKIILFTRFFSVHFPLSDEIIKTTAFERVIHRSSCCCRILFNIMNCQTCYASKFVKLSIVKIKFQGHNYCPSIEQKDDEQNYRN